LRCRPRHGKPARLLRRFEGGERAERDLISDPPKYGHFGRLPTSLKLRRAGSAGGNKKSIPNPDHPKSAVVPQNIRHPSPTTVPCGRRRRPVENRLPDMPKTKSRSFASSIPVRGISSQKTGTVKNGRASCPQLEPTSRRIIHVTRRSSSRVIEFSNVWKKRRWNFQSLEKSREKVPMVGKIRVRNSNVWRNDVPPPRRPPAHVAKPHVVMGPAHHPSQGSRTRLAMTPRRWTRLGARTALGRAV